MGANAAVERRSETDIYYARRMRELAKQREVCTACHTLIAHAQLVRVGGASYHDYHAPKK